MLVICYLFNGTLFTRNIVYIIKHIEFKRSNNFPFVLPWFHTVDIRIDKFSTWNRYSLVQPNLKERRASWSYRLSVIPFLSDSCSMFTSCASAAIILKIAGERKYRFHLHLIGKQNWRIWLSYEELDNGAERVKKNSPLYDITAWRSLTSQYVDLSLTSQYGRSFNDVTIWQIFLWRHNMADLSLTS